jgi:hypothetical protein
MTRIRTTFVANFTKLSVSGGRTTQCQWYMNANTEHWWNNRYIKRNDSFVRKATLPATANNAINKSRGFPCLSYEGV